MALAKGKSKLNSKTLRAFVPVFLLSAAAIGKALAESNLDWSNPAVTAAILSGVGIVLRFLTEEPLK